MIVCSCNVLSDTDIRGCLRGEDAPLNVGAVYRCLGCTPKCGGCIGTIRTIIETERMTSGEAPMQCCFAEAEPQLA